MKVQVNWKELPGYPALVKGQAAGVVAGCLLAAAGVSHPWREVEYGYFMRVAPPGAGRGDCDAPAVPRATAANRGASAHSVTALHRWQPLPPLPHGICWSSGAASAGGLVVVGGRIRSNDTAVVPGKATDEVWFLDFANDAKEWVRLEDRPSPAVVANTFSAGEFVYTCFGSEWFQSEEVAFEASNGDLTIYRMNVANGSGWEVVTIFPGKPRWFPNVTVCGNKLYVIGGHNKTILADGRPDDCAAWEIQDKGTLRLAFEIYNDVWEYDLGTAGWIRKANAPRAFNDRGFSYRDRWVICTGGATSVINDDTHHTRLLTYDGSMDFVSYSSEVWAYDSHSGEWQTLDSLPYGIMSHAIAPSGDRVYLVGNETRGRPSVHNTVFEGTLSVK